MMKRLGGEKSPRKMTLRSVAGSKVSRSGNAASIAYRSIAGSLASKRPQARRTHPGSVKSLPAMVVSDTMAQHAPEMKSNEESIMENPLPSTIAASSPGNFTKSLKSSSTKKRPNQMGENSRRCPATIAIIPARGTHLPAPRGRARDKNVMASNLGELVATGVLRADNAALLMTITPNLTLDTALGPQQILQLATTLRLYTKLETHTKKTASSAIEKLIFSMADVGCAQVVQPRAVDPKLSEPVPWDAMVETWVCQPNNVLSDNKISKGHGGLPVILEDDSGAISRRQEDSLPAGESKHCRLKPADDAMAAQSRTSAAHRGPREKRSQSQGPRSASGAKLGPRERGRLHIERRHETEIGTLANRESRSVGAESRYQNGSLHSRRIATQSTTQGAVATRESTRGRGLLENRSAKSHITNDHNRSSENARSGSILRASRHRNQQDEFSGAVSIIKGDSSKDSCERVRWVNQESNMRKEEPYHEESGRTGHGFLRMFGIGGNKNQEDEGDAKSDSDSDAESDSDSNSSDPSESEDSDEESDDEVGEEIEHALTTEGSADILERKQTLRTWMESRKKNKQPPLEKRVHHLLAAGREKKKDKKKVPEVTYDQGGILGAASEDLSSTGSLNTFTSIPSQVLLLGEDGENETTAESSTTVTSPSPVPPVDPAGNTSTQVDTDSLDQLRRLFHVDGMPDFLDDCVEVEMSQNPGVGKRREDLILFEQDPPSEQPTPKTTKDPLQIFEPQLDNQKNESAEPLKSSGKALALKRRDESMNLLMSFSRSGATIDGSGSGSISSDASNDSNSTEDEGSLVEAIAHELLETSSLGHILLASGMQRKMKKPSSQASRKKMESTAIIKEGSHEDILARTCSDISRDAAMQGCAPGIVGCHRPCPMPPSYPNQALSPTAEQKSTLFFLEIQHRRWQQEQQEKHQQEPPQVAHGIYTIPTAAATSDSSFSVTTTDDCKKWKNNKGASSLGFWSWISSG